MRSLQRNRPRLLVISSDTSTTDDLVTLLTGYGYFVDYVDSRSEGIATYRKKKHAAIIIDGSILPRFPNRLFRLFRYYNRNPIILVAAQPSQISSVNPFLRFGVYDLLQLPLDYENVEVTLRRLVEYNRLQSQSEFMETFIVMALGVTPLGALVIYLLATYWGPL